MFGLGFVLSFGYWTTNFVEVQRAMASNSISSARKTPIIGAFPKMFVPFITIIPGMIAAVLVTEIAKTKSGEAVPGGASGDVKFNDSLLFLMKEVLPNGLLGVAITGLLAAFMAGMAANISAFNTVLSYDLWETYVVKEREDDYYLRVGRVATVFATVVAIFTAALASNFSNIMDYLQTLFGFFNAPLFATFILGMFWKRMTPAAGWIGLASGTLAAVTTAILCEGTLGSLSQGVIPLSGPGRVVRRGVGGFRGRHRAQRRDLAGDAAQAGLRAEGPRLLRDSQGGPRGRRRGDVPVVPPDHPAGLDRAGHGHHPERDLLRSRES